MKERNIARWQTWIAGFALAALPGIGLAGVYKWVDEHGKTHYSDTKPNAGKSNTETVKTDPQPARSNPSTENWQQQEAEFQRRRAQRDRENAPRAARHPESLSNGRDDGTDDSRCRLARDVLSGAVRHSNGAPTDKHDREVAEQDIKRFCK